MTRIANILLLALTAPIVAFIVGNAQPEVTTASCGDGLSAPASSGDEIQRRPAQPAVSISQFGALGDGLTDDTTAIQRAFDTVKDGSTIAFPQGIYRHHGVLTIRHAGTQLLGFGATLLATNERTSALHIDADSVVVRGLTLSVVSTSRRWDAAEQHKVWISGHRGVELHQVSVLGSAAAGIFVTGGASDFILDRPIVQDTRADGIHITGGSHDGTVFGAHVTHTGDDGIAVVSYQSDAQAVAKIRVIRPWVTGNTWGRGLSVVGGEGIVFCDVSVESSSGAGLYVASEGSPYYTRDSKDIEIYGGRVTRANFSKEIDQGAVLVYSGHPGHQVSNILIANISVNDTSTRASRNVGVVSDGGDVSGIIFRNISIDGGPASAFAGNVGPSVYKVEGSTSVNGQPYYSTG